jgi:hypothetical protein
MQRFPNDGILFSKQAGRSQQYKLKFGKAAAAADVHMLQLAEASLTYWFSWAQQRARLTNELLAAAAAAAAGLFVSAVHLAPTLLRRCLLGCTSRLSS